MIIPQSTTTFYDIFVCLLFALFIDMCFLVYVEPILYLPFSILLCFLFLCIGVLEENAWSRGSMEMIFYYSYFFIISITRLSRSVCSSVGYDARAAPEPGRTHEGVDGEQLSASHASPPSSSQNQYQLRPPGTPHSQCIRLIHESSIVRQPLHCPETNIC